MKVKKKELPIGWSWEELGRVCKITMGQSPPSTSYNKNGVGLPFFQGKAEFTDLYPNEEKWCTEPSKIAEANDVLLSVRAPVGGTNIANQKCCIGRGLASISYENYKYLFYYLRSIVQELDSKGTGTTFRAISGKAIKDTLFPVAPKATQQAIVSKIEELFSELDKGVENLRKAQQQLKTYRQSVLKWAFEGKLTQKNNGNSELPVNWKLVKLSDISKVSGGITKNSKRSNYELQLPFLRVANVYFNHLDLSEIHTIGVNEAEIGRVKLEKNDLLFVEGNGSLEQIGRVALWSGAIENCVHQNHLIKSRLSDLVIPKYALYFFCSENGRSKIREQANSTSGLHTLSLSKISQLEVPIAPICEQQEVVQAIESRLSVADKLEETITQSLQQAESLKQSILKKAFEGKLI